MKMIGVAELKSRLSEYLAQVKSGEEILITDRGTPIAKIVSAEAPHSNLDRLIREGLAAPGSRSLADEFFEKTRPASEGIPLSELVIEERRTGR